MKARNYPPAKCTDCGHYTRTLCLTCGMPLCEQHADFPTCADCSAEADREAMIERAERDRDRALEGN